ncbi:MAG: rpmI [Acidobacteria bacterium]|nr:rpmI [Acidobacteriota bacterium]
MAKKAKKIKLKTHRGAAKRFKRTKNGKFTRGSAFSQHILTSKTRKRKRGLKGTTTVSKADTPKIARMLPYK